MRRLWAWMLLAALALPVLVDATETGTKTSRWTVSIWLQGESRYAHADSSDRVWWYPEQEADTTGQGIEMSSYQVAAVTDSIPRWYVDLTEGDVGGIYVQIAGTGSLQRIPDVSGIFFTGTAAHDGFIRNSDAFTTGVVDNNALTDNPTFDTITGEDGQLDITNDLQVDGDTYLGDALGDSTTVTGTLKQTGGPVELSGDVDALGDLTAYGDIILGNALTDEVTLDGVVEFTAFHYDSLAASVDSDTVSVDGVGEALTDGKFVVCIAIPAWDWPTMLTIQGATERRWLMAAPLEQAATNGDQVGIRPDQSMAAQIEYVILVFAITI